MIETFVGETKVMQITTFGPPSEDQQIKELKMLTESKHSKKYNQESGNVFRMEKCRREKPNADIPELSDMTERDINKCLS